MEKLSDISILGTGTAKENPVSRANQILLSRNSLQKTECGTCHFCCTDSISLTSWNDNSACEVSSNCYQVETTGKVQRWVKAKGLIEVSQQNAIMVYNELKSGVFFSLCKHTKCESCSSL